MREEDIAIVARRGAEALVEAVTATATMMISTTDEGNIDVCLDISFFRVISERLWIFDVLRYLLGYCSIIYRYTNTSVKAAAKIWG